MESAVWAGRETSGAALSRTCHRKRVIITELRNDPNLLCKLRIAGDFCCHTALSESGGRDALCEGLLSGDHVNAVLEAADNWVTALEALVAARQASRDTEATQEAFDIAGSQLVVAVKNRRSVAERT
jgi:hypothetical protein